LLSQLFIALYYSISEYENIEDTVEKLLMKMK